MQYQKQSDFVLCGIVIKVIIIEDGTEVFSPLLESPGICLWFILRTMCNAEFAPASFTVL